MIAEPVPSVSYETHAHRHTDTQTHANTHTNKQNTTFKVSWLRLVTVIIKINRQPTS